MDTKDGTAPKTTVSRSVATLGVLVLILMVALVALLILQIRTTEKLRAEIASVRDSVGPLQISVQQAAANAGKTDALAGHLQSLTATTKAMAGAQESVREELKSLRKEMTTFERARSGVASVAALPGTAAPVVPAKPASVPPARVESQADLLAELAALKSRLDNLKLEVVVREKTVIKETEVVQEQISDVKGRIGQAEQGVEAIRKTLAVAALPELKKNVHQVRADIAEVETEIRAITRKSEQFQGTLQGFFKDVFYNDPWDRMTAQGQ